MEATNEKPALLTASEAAKRLGVSRSTAHKILRTELGVHRIVPPGSKKPIVRVEPQVIERILRRTSNRA